MALSQFTQLAWLRRYATQNPLLALWGLMLFCGGSVLLSYHAHLRYLPDFNLVELAGLMASVTLIGLLLIASFFVSCFVPGLTLRWIEHKWPLIPYRRYLHLREMLFLWFSSVAIWAVYLLYSKDLLALLPADVRPFAGLPGVCLAAILAALLASRKTAAAFSLKHWRHRLISRHTVAFTVWTTLFLYPISAALTMATAGDIRAEIPVIIFAITLLTIFNSIVYLTDFTDIRNTIGIDGLLAFLLVVVTLGLAVAFSQSVMQSLALGDRNAATLTLTGKTCHSFERFGARCAPNETTELENVNVLSRVGTTVLLELLVRQTPAHKENEAPIPDKTETLHLLAEHRRLYCLPSPAEGPPTCSACESRILQRVEAGPYRDELVCVKITVPKADIVNIVFGANRQYTGYSGVLQAPAAQ